jgi:hypothetical protein
MKYESVLVGSFWQNKLRRFYQHPGALRLGWGAARSPRVRCHVRANFVACIPYSIVKQPVVSFTESKRDRPLFMSLGQGVARLLLSFASPHKGDGAPTRRMAWITPGRPERFLPSGRDWIRRAPSALRFRTLASWRATAAISAYAYAGPGPVQRLCSAGGLPGDRPWVDACVVRFHPQDAAPISALTTPRADAPWRDGMPPP